MEKKYWFIIILSAILIGNMVSCKDSDFNSNGPGPEVSFVFDTLVADMNEATNVPIVAMVNSEDGLKSVQMYIDKENGESVLLKEVETFFNVNQYSLVERPTYEENYKDFRVVATDVSNHTTTVSVPFRIIGYKNAPEVKFEVPEIVINEMLGDKTPHTRFTVESTTTLKSIQVSRYFKNQAPQVVYSENFKDAGKEISTFNFDDSIPYTENDLALQVTVVDSYGKSKISTLPIKYTAIPVPSISGMSPSRFIVDLKGNGTLEFKAESQVGIKQIKLVSMHKAEEYADIVSDTYSSVKAVDYRKVIIFTDDEITGVKIVVTDVNNKAVEMTVPAIVGLDYLPDQWLGSQFYTRGIPEEPGIYGMYSLNLKRGMSIYEAYKNPANVDFLFYMYDQISGAAAFRFLSPLMPSDATRYKSGPWYSDLLNDPSIPNFSTWNGLNATRYVQLNSSERGFTFDNVTLKDLNDVLKSSVNLERLRGKTVASEVIAPGYVYLFKTGPNSAAGSEKIGVFKIEEVTYVTSMPAVTHPWSTSAKISSIGKIRISIKMPK